MEIMDVMVDMVEIGREGRYLRIFYSIKVRTVLKDGEERDGSIEVIQPHFSELQPVHSLRDGWGLRWAIH